MFSIDDCLLAAMWLSYTKNLEIRSEFNVKFKVTQKYKQTTKQEQQK